MSRCASDGIGNHLYLLIPLTLSSSLSLSLALSHSTPPLIHLLCTLSNISHNTIFLSRRLATFSFSRLQSLHRHHHVFPANSNPFLLSLASTSASLLENTWGVLHTHRPKGDPSDPNQLSVAGYVGGQVPLQTTAKKFSLPERKPQKK